MDPDRKARLEDLLKRGSLAAGASDPVASLPPAAELTGATPDPETRFEIGERIGGGSMGEVFRAFDRELQRTVALKFLRPENAVLMAQFLREARAQARVENENIGKVYDVGEWGGRAFIAMQYIDGQPLGVAAGEMTLEEKLHVMIRVTEAVHAAHRAGFIHRDLKPGNILVERSPDGWKPYVVDFGLAREVDSATGTRTGMIAGSPAYMAPEQARGEIRHLDRRTDVYGLGATLFDLLSGRPPFEGPGGAQVLVQVLQQEAPLLRALDPAIPADLEAIVEKCLRKEPQKRYESALALAEDLRRYAAGEAVLARSTRWSYRALRRVRRNPALSAVIAAAVVVTLVLSLLWIRERWRAVERTRLAQEYTQQAERLQAFLRYSYMLPLHDLSREKELVQEGIRSMEKNLQRSGDLAAGPGHSAIGRAYLQLQQYQKARYHLELSRRAGQSDAETAYALGRALGALFQQGLQEAARHSGKDREERKRQLDGELRDPARLLLQSDSRESLESADYLKGLIEFYDGKYNAALQHASRAARSTPWLYEAVKLEGDIHLFAGIEKRKKELWPEALSEYELAGAAYEKALQAARSDPGLHLADCERAIQELEVTYYVQRVFPPTHGTALEVCSRALLADPENAEAFYKRSRIYYRVGDYAYSHGLPFREHFHNAIAAGERALALNPANDAYYDFITAPLQRLAWHKWDHGEDPEPELGRMIQFAQKANDHGQVAVGYLLRAEMETDTGKDPRASLDAASRYVERVPEYAPDSIEIYNLRGAVLDARARYEMLAGRDPGALLDQAAVCYQRVCDAYPNYPLPRLHLAGSRYAMAEFEYSRGRDAQPYLDQAAGILRQALKLDPYYAAASLLMGRVSLLRALARVRAGVAPEASFREAEEQVRWALKTSPDDANAHRCLARVHLERATTTMSGGEAARSEIRSAESELRLAGERNPNHFEQYLLAAKLNLLKARIGDSHHWTAQAKDALQRGLARNPGHPELLALAKEVQ